MCLAGGNKMENRPVISFTGRTAPADIEEKWTMWREGAYIPLYLKAPGVRCIDTYKIIRKTHDLPDYIFIFHGDNFENFKKRQETNQEVAAIDRDMNITFRTVEQFWRNVYELIRSFRNNGAAVKSMESIVDDAQVISIEGYKLPANEYDKYESWFIKWASRIYVPMLLRVSGVKACNFFRLLDYKSPNWANDPVIEKDMPRYMSVTYYDNLKLAEDFRQSLDYIAFRRNMELEFASLKTVWDTEYQLFSSHRP
jgi:hypothetical protein